MRFSFVYVSTYKNTHCDHLHVTAFTIPCDNAYVATLQCKEYKWMLKKKKMLYVLSLPKISSKGDILSLSKILCTPKCVDAELSIIDPSNIKEKK